MLTPFGIAIRKLRLDQGMRLLDLAETMNRTSAFLSAVETGKKPIPRGYVAEVADAMSLSECDRRLLQRAADESKDKVSTENMSADQRALVAAFARRLDELPPEFLEEIKKRVFKSVAGEIPFKRRRKGLLVSPASADTIWQLSNQVRSAFVSQSDVNFPIMDVLEFRLEKFSPGFYLDVCGVSEMGEEEGLVIAGEECIKLREDVYEGAWFGHGRARFTASHELGHFIMHRKIKMARVRSEHQPIYQDAEWQADTFAGSLLFSASHLGSLRDADDAADQCGMTPSAAQVMWAKYEQKGLC
ncbi:XRE family transcriptional regulator [Methylobacterium sp. Leaf93]|uniref:helix-turn-helix domain-containing protein n=1 Tax=Methylobacterium sp. Leaf93 TaxID=1736249 RepID=UPI000AFBE54F|nr:XRE family transcriptional regulator [Methylobacterium sp. Leaf93]